MSDGPQPPAHRIRAWEEVEVGEQVPDFSVVLSLQRLVMEAGANRDFAPWHFDPEAARDAGAPTVNANTTLAETLLEAGLRSWGGLSARIRMIDFELRGFNCVGDEVCTRGRVTDKPEPGLVELEIWLESERGRTVSGSALVALPAGGAMTRV